VAPCVSAQERIEFRLGSGDVGGVPTSGWGVEEMRRVAVTAVVATLSLLIGLTPATATTGSRFRRAVRSKGGVVATESRPAARVGIRVLDRGGNAVDAAAATVLAIGVTQPQSCGIGGGGFLVYRSAEGRSATLDFREKAPAAFTPTVFEQPGIHNDFSGHRTIGVPGVVDGMRKALNRFGTISFKEAVAPAARLAERGIRVTPATARAMAEEGHRLRLFPEAARIYLEDGEPFEPGDLLRLEDYARSLRLLREQGADAFYQGRIARLIMEDMRQSGDYPGDRGLMTRDDLASYRAKWRRPLFGSYRKHQIVAMPPPTSGGIAIIEMLNILEGFDIRSFGHSSADHFHYLAEAQKIAWADRNAYVADTDFVDVPVEGLVSKSYAASRRAAIRRNRAQTYRPGVFDVEDRITGVDEPGGSTTHVSVIDGWGNAVAVTCTIEQNFGSGVVAPGTGFLLNNQLTDFGDPGTANEPEGGKRPRSSMSPTIVVSRGEPVLVAGGAGGSLIIMGVLHAIVNVVDFRKGIGHALDAERMDAQLAVTEPEMLLLIEDARVGPRVEAELQRRGHVFDDLNGEYDGEYARWPRIQAAAVSRRFPGANVGASDPRAEWGTLGQR
jgi:gamma-glutamyltranspeptidase/glutathione hydrolase